MVIWSLAHIIQYNGLKQNGGIRCSSTQRWYSSCEFDFPFPTVDILSRVGVIILHLQRFEVVNIVGVNPKRAQIGNLDVHVSHTCLYTRIHVWLKIKDGIGGWTTIAHQHTKHYFSTIFLQPHEYWIAWKDWQYPKSLVNWEKIL